MLFFLGNKFSNDTLSNRSIKRCNPKNLINRVGTNNINTMKKIILSIFFATIGLISSQKVQSQIIVTPTLCLQTSGSCDVTAYPNSTLYPNYYEVNLRVTAMVNTFQYGHFSLYPERRVYGTTTWGQFTPNTPFPNTGPSAPLSSTYSGTGKVFQVEGTVYEYRVRVVFSSSQGSKTVYTPIRKATVLGVPTPCFTMLNVVSSQNENSYYGPQTVNNICQNAVTINGSCSKFEQGYHIRIAEFNLATWSFGTDYYNNWVSGTGEAPPFISLNALAAQNGHYFQTGKVYIVSLSIGPVWKSAPPQFFRVLNTCRSGNDSSGDGIKDITVIEPIKDYFEVNSLKLYPNPTKENTVIQVDKSEKILSYTIYDNTGMVVKREKITGEFNEKSIQLSDVRKGFYLITVETNKQVYKEKLIKE